MGSILQILQSDWFREWAVFSPSGQAGVRFFSTNHLLGFRKKIKMLFTSQGRSVIGKTVPSVLCTQDLGHSFSQYGPPVWWITYICALYQVRSAVIRYCFTKIYTAIVPAINSFSGNTRYVKLIKSRGKIYRRLWEISATFHLSTVLPPLWLDHDDPEVHPTSNVAY